MTLSKSLVAFGIAMKVMTAVTVLAGEPATLPFSVTVTEEKIEKLPDYMGPNNPGYMDFPYNPPMIDGEYWIICTNAHRRRCAAFQGQGHVLAQSRVPI